MTDQQSILERTRLKYIGSYLLYGDLPVMGLPNESEKEFLDKTYEQLRELLENPGDIDTGDILDAVQAFGAAHESVGFYTGMKAGARLLLGLTDEADIWF